MKNTISLFDFSKKINYKNELLAGFTVAMTMIPNLFHSPSWQVFLHLQDCMQHV